MSSTKFFNSPLSKGASSREAEIESEENSNSPFPKLSAWKITLTLPCTLLPVFTRLLEPVLPSLVITPDTPSHSLLTLYSAPSEIALVKNVIAIAAEVTGLAPLQYNVEKLSARDWLTSNQTFIDPLYIKPFFIRPSVTKEKKIAPPSSIPLTLQGNTAFGAGDHPTTQGCLQALASIKALPSSGPRLDMGCGTGILAIAMAKLWKQRVIAIDIDPQAVAASRFNIIHNHVNPFVSVHRSKGYYHPLIRYYAPYQVITANILARPLKQFAPLLARFLAPNGLAILSGLLVTHVPQILNIHQAYGFTCLKHLHIQGWSTLVLTRSASLKNSFKKIIF